MTIIDSVCGSSSGGEGKGIPRILILIILLLAFPLAPGVFASPGSSRARIDSGCWFNREGESRVPAAAIDRPTDPAIQLHDSGKSVPAV